MKTDAQIVEAGYVNGEKTYIIRYGAEERKEIIIRNTRSAGETKKLMIQKRDFLCLYAYFFVSSHPEIGMWCEGKHYTA